MSRIAAEVAEASRALETDLGPRVIYIDNRGFIYCAKHGRARQSDTPCRKLRAHELRRLERDETVNGY